VESLLLCPFCKKPHGQGRNVVGKVVKCQNCRRTLVPWSRTLAFTVLLGSVLVATTYAMIMKQKAAGENGLVTTTIFLTVTALVLGAVAICAGDAIPWPPPVRPTLALVYLAVVGSVVAFLVFFWLLDRAGLLVSSTLVFVFPLVAIITDALFERDLPLTARAYLGAAITLGGLAVSLVRRGRR